MDIKIKVDSGLVSEVLQAMRLEDRVSIIANALYELTIRHAETRIGGTFGKSIAAKVELETRGDHAEIRMDRANAYIGAHVHFGGPIRSRNGKMLALPTKWNDQPDLFARNRSDLKLIRSKRKNRAYLFKNLYEAGVIGRPLFVLTPRTKPQRPRPWWPTQAEAEAEIARYLDENF